MWKTVQLILVLAMGSLLGLFGVFNSVFADGGAGERMATIAVILLLYAALSAGWAFFASRYSWQWGALLSAPGALLLAAYSLGEGNPYYLLYLVVLVAVSVTAARYGGSARRRS